MRRTEIVASVIGLVLSFLTYWGTLYFPKFPIYLAGPEFFPQLLSILLAGLSIALLIQTLVKKKLRRERMEEEDRGHAKENIFWKVVMAMGHGSYFLAMAFWDSWSAHSSTLAS
jgi:prepilin signal peptidase PulO-like enzyme (type II secretory pathway)